MIPVCNTNPPVLLQQGFTQADLVILTNRVVNQPFRIRTDRGYLKHLDLFPYDNNVVFIQEKVLATVNLGGQNLLEDANIGMWSILSQFGKNHTWQLRAKFNQGQTGFLTLNGNVPPLATRDQSVQLVAKYSTPAHEQFLKDFRLKYGQGLKQRQYQLDVPVTAVAGTINRIQEELPRNSGSIIGIGISLVEDITDAVIHPALELPNSFLTLSIDGVAIVENVSVIYYSYENGRDYYLQPVCINPGSQMELEILSNGINTTAYNVGVTFFFGN